MAAQKGKRNKRQNGNLALKKALRDNERGEDIMAVTDYEMVEATVDSGAATCAPLPHLQVHGVQD